MKMKQLKPILITLAVCVVLGVATFAAIKLIPQKDPGEVTPSVSGDSDSIYIVNKTANLVESVVITPDVGKKFSIHYTNDDEGNQVSTLKGEGEEFKYDEDVLYTLAGYVGVLVAIDEIENPQGRDAEFGFNNPRRKLDVKFKDKQSIELILGADAPSGDGVYLKCGDSGRVYLIGGSTTNMLMRSQLDYRDLSLYEEYVTIDAINEVTIERDGKEKIVVARKQNAEPVSDENPVSAQYEVISPDYSDADNTAVENKLLTPLIAIKSASLEEDHPKDLKKYGLDKPVIVSFKDNYGGAHTLKIGDTAESGGNYIMCDDVPSVLVTAEAVPFLNIEYTDFMMELLWLHNMKDVSNILYTLPSGEQHTLEFKAGSDGKTTASFDGGAISSTNATNLYMHTIQFTIQGLIDNTMKYGAPEYRMQMLLNNGTLTTLELSRINERQYAVSVDGATPRYYVSVSQVNALSEAFKTLLSGGEIKSIF